MGWGVVGWGGGGGGQAGSEAILYRALLHSLRVYLHNM